MRTALAFIVGAAAGAAAVGWYFKHHALELTAGGIADKVFGEGSTAANVTRGIAGAIEGAAN